MSFDAGYRIENFQLFAGDDQILSMAQSLAERASEEVTTLRECFPTPSHVQAWIAGKPPTSIRDHYHLAVSAGMAGAIEQSKQSFAHVMSDPVDRPWAAELRRRAAELTRCLDIGNGFEAEIMGTIKRTRKLLGLPGLASL